MRLIDADILIKKYIDTDIQKFHDNDVIIVLENLKENIKRMPTIELKKGEWEEINVIDYKAKCSVCGTWSPIMSNFCPCCGARMKGESDE